jgi:hypothetical protein
MRWGARRGNQGAGAAVPVGGGAALTPPVAQDGFWLAAAAEALMGKELLGRLILYRWPGHGWVRGWVVRITSSTGRAAGFSHGVRYARGSAVGVGPGDVASLLDVPRGLARRRAPACQWGRGG